MESTQETSVEARGLGGDFEFEEQTRPVHSSRLQEEDHLSGNSL